MFARDYYRWLWTESAVTRVVFLKLYYLFPVNTELLWSMTMLSTMTWLMMMVELIGSRWKHRIHTLMSSCHGNQMWNDVGHRFGPTHWVLIGQIVVIWQISELWLVRLLKMMMSDSQDWELSENIGNFNRHLAQLAWSTVKLLRWWIVSQSSPTSGVDDAANIPPTKYLELSRNSNQTNISIIDNAGPIKNQFNDSYFIHD